MYSPSKGGRLSTCRDAGIAVRARLGVSGIVAKPLISNTAGVDLKHIHTHYNSLSYRVSKSCNVCLLLQKVQKCWCFLCILMSFNFLVKCATFRLFGNHFLQCLVMDISVNWHCVNRQNKYSTFPVMPQRKTYHIQIKI